MRIQRYEKTVKIWASAKNTYDWAHRVGSSWPCSTISGKRLLIELNEDNLVDLAVNGKTGDVDVDGHELNAFIQDSLA